MGSLQACDIGQLLLGLICLWDGVQLSTVAKGILTLSVTEYQFVGLLNPVLIHFLPKRLEAEGLVLTLLVGS